MVTLAEKTAGEALELMRDLGVPPVAATLYLSLLGHGAVSKRAMRESMDLGADILDNALQYLSLFLLISQDIVHGEPTYFASNPRNVWKAHDTQFYWMRSMHIGAIDKLPPLPEMEDERRRQLYARLARLCGMIYDGSAKAHDPLRHRHRDIGSGQLFASWLALAISGTSTRIVVVERPPRLPELAPIWVALTGRLRAGVKYTRIVLVDEVVEHGLSIVDRDMSEYGIDLRLARSPIKDAFYIFDDKRLLLKNTRGEGRDGRAPHFGVYTCQHQIVRRYVGRFQDEYLPASESAAPTVARLREHADRCAERLRTAGRVDDAEVFLSVARFGKFSPVRLSPDAAARRLVADGLLKVNESNHLVMVVAD